MSLVHHVTSIEDFDRDSTALYPHHDLLSRPASRAASDAGRASVLHDDAALDDPSRPSWRRLSFDAFAPDEGLLGDLLGDLPPVPHEAAYKVSTARRLLQVATAAVACAVASGIIFGFAALKPVLVAEGVYADLCGDAAAVFGDDAGDDNIPVPVPCAEQDLRLNLFFVSGSIAANVSCLFAGAFLDRFGRRACFVLASVLIAVASVLMGSAFAIPEFDGYLLANVLLALGGTFVFVPSFELANAFPRHGGLIVAVVTGSFDASSAVFLFYQMAWEASAGALTPSRFFFGYAAVVPLLLLLVEWGYMPAGAYHSTPELEHKIEKARDRSHDVHSSDEEIPDLSELRRVRSSRAEARMARLDQIVDLVGDSDAREERVKQADERHAVSVVWGVLHGLPAHRQMVTPWFVLVLLSTILQMLRMNYFIASIRSQYRFMLGSDRSAEEINLFFDVALPVGGLLSTPFIGLLLNNLSVGWAWVILTACTLLNGVFNYVAAPWAGYVTVVFFVLFRPLYYSAVSDYATKVFGFATFGRIYGTLTCVSGLVQFAQTGLDALLHGPLHEDPRPINAVLTVLSTALGASLATYVFVHGKQYREELKEQEACVEGERQRLMSVAEEGCDYGAAE